MEQVTQAILGGVAAQAFCTKALGKKAWVVGAVAGVLPDLDLFLEPLADPRFPIELHRTWTHALAITPLGALLTVLLLLPIRGFRERWKAVYVAACVGWITHAPLDACTSYGTRLWLPFSDAWVAWDLISIIDPVFSIILLVGLIKAVRRASPRPAIVALCLALLYLGLGMVQRERALSAQRQLAFARNHVVEHARAIPVLGSVVLWRTLYRSRGWVYADAHRLLPFMEAGVQEQGRELWFDPVAAGATWPDDVRHRFHVFTDGLAIRSLAVDPKWAPLELRMRIVDPRYSYTYGLDGFWGMDVPYAGTIQWFDFREDVASGLGPVLLQVFGMEGTWVSRDQLSGTR